MSLDDLYGYLVCLTIAGGMGLLMLLFIPWSTPGPDQEKQLAQSRTAALVGLLFVLLCAGGAVGVATYEHGLAVLQQAAKVTAGIVGFLTFAVTGSLLFAPESPWNTRRSDRTPGRQVALRAAGVIVLVLTLFGIYSLGDGGIGTAARWTIGTLFVLSWIWSISAKDSSRAAPGTRLLARVLFWVMTSLILAQYTRYVASNTGRPEPMEWTAVLLCAALLAGDAVKLPLRVQSWILYGLVVVWFVWTVTYPRRKISPGCWFVAILYGSYLAFSGLKLLRESTRKPDPPKSINDPVPPLRDL